MEPYYNCETKEEVQFYDEDLDEYNQFMNQQQNHSFEIQSELLNNDNSQTSFHYFQNQGYFKRDQHNSDMIFLQNSINPIKRVYINQGPIKFQRKRKQIFSDNDLYPRRKNIITMTTLQKAKQVFQRKEKGHDIKLDQIAKLLGLGYSTVTNLHNEWKYDPGFFAKTASIRSRDLNTTGFTTKRTEFIKELLTENPFLTQEQMIEKVKNNPQLTKNGKQVTRYNIHDALKRLNYVKKQTSTLPKNNDSSQAQILKRNLCKTIWPFWKTKGKVFFFKIEKVNIYTIRAKAWGPPNQKINMNAPCSKTNNLIIIMLANKQGFLQYYIHTQGATKRQTLKSIVQLIKVADLPNNKQHILLMNQKFILSKQVQQLFQKLKFNVLNIPQDFLQFNPLDSYLRQLKSDLKRNHFRDYQQMKCVLEITIKLPICKTLCKYIDFMNNYMESNKQT